MSQFGIKIEHAHLGMHYIYQWQVAPWAKDCPIYTRWLPSYWVNIGSTDEWQADRAIRTAIKKARREGRHG